MQFYCCRGYDVFLRRTDNWQTSCSGLRRQRGNSYEKGDVLGTIWCTSRDHGGTLGMLPVAKSLGQLGHDVEMFVTADGAGIKLADGGGVSYRTFISASALLDEVCGNLGGPRPDVLVTSMCSSTNLGRDLIPSLRGCGVIVVGLQDYWNGQMIGGAGNDLFVEREFWPDYLAVNDTIGKRGALEHWRGFDEDRIWVTGYPALDRFASMDVAAIRSTTREQLSISPDATVVLFAGQLDGTGKNLALLVNAMNGVSGFVPAILIARHHPRMLTEQWVTERVEWDAALARFSGRLIDSTGVDIGSVIAASNVVVSEYSTANVEAATLGIPNITMQVCERLPYGHELVELGCSAFAGTSNDLNSAISSVLMSGSLGLEDAQRRTFQLDGGNARRVAEYIQQLQAK